MNTRPIRVPNAAAAPALDAEAGAAITRLFEQDLRFQRLLGLRVHTLQSDQVACTLDMRDDLIGHAAQQRLHGGVVCAALDSVAGLAIMVALAVRHADEPLGKRLLRFAKMGTIDLRVDFLRTATGPAFHATANVLRLGSRVASTRMELYSAQGGLLCTGSGAFIVS